MDNRNIPHAIGDQSIDATYPSDIALKKQNNEPNVTPRI